MTSKKMLPHSHTFDAIGTSWEISSGRALSTELITTIHETIDEFDRVYSRFRSDSLVSAVSRQTGYYTFPKSSMAIFDFYKELYDMSEGRVTPLIGDMLVRAGYDATYSFREQPQTELPLWDEVMEWQGSLLHSKKPTSIDIGALGKGYLVDAIAKLLDSYNETEYVIDASGDLCHKGTSTNKVGLEHPTSPDMVIGIVDIKNKSLCASASNRRAWGHGMHHIFNPVTKSPVRDIIATWVIADTTMIADGLATALFFVDPKALHSRYDFQYVRMHADGSLDYSSHFGGELF